jgi:hypothetical protein
MRSALWALGLAGAAYAWQNRDRLRQQFNQVRGGGTPRQLPDYGTTPERGFDNRDSTWEQTHERQFGGADV